jgi:deoxyribodipyrimidine photo-lyase
MQPLERNFSSRASLTEYLRQQFPECAAKGADISFTEGGRAAALRLLAKVNPDKYGRDRNFLDGSVSRLSPYLRHGVMSLAEVRRKALAAGRHTEKFISELAWRDYWQRIYAQIGDGIWQDRERYKTGFSADDYQTDLPTDISDGTTGLACMDGFASELKSTGYLHNHARMWLAAFVVHFRRVRWQAGARWFLEHLLDGDRASNNLSWQWVASTFSHKPYFFNRDNLERYTNSTYCRRCARADDCPFEASYEELAGRIFRIEQMP